MTKVRLVRWAAAVALVAMLVGGAPAEAAPGATAVGVAVSRDGVHWSARLPTPLFDAATAWVPGDSRSAAFYIRNQAADPARLSVAVRVSDPDGLVGNKDIRIGAGIPGASPHELTGGTTRWDGPVLAVGQARQLSITADFDPASPNRSQRRHLSFDVVVTLSSDLGMEGSPGSGGPGGPLAFTGADLRWSTLAVAALLGVGVALLGSGRAGARRRPQRSRRAAHG